jgi:hypothetical protein
MGMTTNEMTRELATYGETLNPPASALDLVIGLSMHSLPVNQADQVRAIISSTYPVITDSLLDEIVEDLDDIEDPE